MSRRLIFFLALAGSLLLSAQSGSKDRRTRVNRGEWSGETVSLFNTWGGLDSNPGRRLSLASPDGEKVVQVRNETVTVVVKGKRFPTNLGQKTNAELGWAPDSQYFFLTWTDSGDTGTWYTDLYRVTDEGIKQIAGFENRVRAAFDLRIRKLRIPKKSTGVTQQIWKEQQYCTPNIVGSQWINGSKELLVSALVPNVGICRYMSEFAVYRVTVPGGVIVESYSAQEAHEQFNPANLPQITN